MEFMNSTGIVIYAIATTAMSVISTIMSYQIVLVI